MYQDSGLLRWMAETTTDGLWVVDPSGRTLYANRRLGQLVGHPREALQGRLLHEVFDGRALEALTTHLEQLRAGVARDDVDTRIERPDGSASWTVASFGPLHDDDGRHVGWWHRVSDHASCLARLDRLRGREQQLASAQQLSGIGSWEWDLAAGTVEWSEEMYRIAGVDTDFSPGVATVRERVHPDDLGRFDAATESMFGPALGFDTDFRLTRPDGGFRWVHGRAVTDVDESGAPVRVRGVAQDISALVEAGEQAEQATRRLNLLQQMAEAANRASCLDEALELAATGLPSHTGWAPVAAFTPSDGADAALPVVRHLWRPTPAADAAQAARAAYERSVVVTPLPDQDGLTRSLVSFPVVTDDDVVCVVQVLADESPLDEHSRSLIDQVSTQLALVAGRELSARTLARARDAAMEASRLKSEFLATMSHEIRTPMNGVIGLNELLLRTELDDHQRRLAEGLQTAGLTLLAIINDILDLSKIESGKLELEVADFDVRAVFDHAAGLLAGPAHDKGLELIVACHPDVPGLVRGDATRFGQVVTNLGANAVKFTDRGQVVVRATLGEPSGPSAGPDADTVLLQVEVSDTGVGILPEDQSRLFDAFIQADPSTTRRHGGTGLGLAISQQLAHALGGAITVRSQVGRGSTFTFTARFARAAVDTEAPASDTGRPGATGALAGRRVLVVDDNEANRLILTEQLAAWRLDAVAVTDAGEGLTALTAAAAAGRPFEVALLDQVMPGTDGLTLTRAIRAEPGLAGLRVVLLSSDMVSGRQAAQAGVDRGLEKPVRHAELHDVLTSLLGARPRRQPSTPSTPATGRARPASRPHPSGPRVLVVEDNAVNQLVATGLLEAWGYGTAIAADGADAVAMLSPGHDFDAVLMDCRMPRLDGFDATRAVRSKERPEQRVPIIAMTASALQGDRERCLEAGMDDFLTKPVAAAELARVLQHWIGVRHPATADASPPAPAQPATTGSPGQSPDPPVLDHDRIRTLDALRKDGVSFFERTAASFLTRAPGQLSAVADALAAADSQALALSAHAVKGTALNLGLPRVAAVAARIEEMADRAGPAHQQGDPAAVSGLLARLEAELDLAIRTLRRELDGRR